MVGIDVVDVHRFRALLERSPKFVERFFSEAERVYCSGFPDPAIRLAGTFAAKEAAMKAWGAVPAAAFARRVEITRESSGAPIARFGQRSIPVSISHDGPVAAAIALGGIDHISVAAEMLEGSAPD